MGDIRNLIEKYYVFTLTFIVLAIALFFFRNDNTIVNIIIGAFVGLIAAPAVLPKENDNNANSK